MWTDTTSYQQDRPRVQTAWTLELPRGSRLRVTVLSEHRYYPGQWTLFVLPFMAEPQPCADATNLAEAQAAAVDYARSQIAKLQQELDAALRLT